ncbi:MAG: cytochrome c biogenesis protein ResB [bacterium]|nr:cytochrome c biogenesis protein ResB [bacterium]
MKFATGLLVVIVLFLLAGVVPVPGGDAGIIFKTPVFMLLVATECVLLLAAAVRQLRAMRLALALAHGGVVVLLLGALLGYLFSKDAEFSVPVGGAQGITQIPATATGVVYTLPFSVRVSDFRVESVPAGAGHATA